MIILTTFWGDNKAYLGLLNDWVEAYIDSGTSYPFYVLTDLETPNTKYPTIRVDVDKERLFIRPNHIFDRKGALMLQALEFIESPILFLDTDATLQRPVQDNLGPWTESRIAITRDTGPRMIDAGYGEPLFKEMCAGVMYFGRGDKRQIATGYRQAFGQLHIKEGLEPLIEQRAWSVLWKRMGGDQLPDSYGWVERHWGKSLFSVVHHDHGPRKLARYTSLRVPSLPGGNR